MNEKCIRYGAHQGRGEDAVSDNDYYVNYK
ncbi:hypothetical protein ES703_02973 [subsurface metagenome]